MSILLFYDTETTGKADMKQDHTFAGQPDLVQMAAILFEEATDKIWCGLNAVVNPYTNADSTKARLFTVGDEVAKIHRITDQDAINFGQPRRTVLSTFNYMCKAADTIVAHNDSFDSLIMLTAFHREGAPHRMQHLKRVCTMKAAMPILKLPKPAGWKGKAKPGDEYKWPTLTECFQHFFGKPFDGAHNAMNDVVAMLLVWKELRKLGAV